MKRMGFGAASTLVRWGIVLVALLGLQAHGLAQTTAEPAQEAVPTLSLVPSEGRPGSTVTASGEGYCGSATLQWDDPVQHDSGDSDEHGNISITFTVPRDAAPGQHTVTSTSECGGTEASFTVVSSPPTTTAEPPPPAAEPPPLAATPPPPTTAPPAAPAPPDDGTSAPPLAPGAPPLAPGAPPPARGGALDSYQDSTLAQYEEIVKRELESGVILYNPPERTQVGVVNRVEVRIAREESGELAEGLQGKADPRVEQLLVGTTMSAKLEGRAFDIIPIGSDVQYLASTGFREWRWDVTPTASGKHSLFFTVWVLHEKYPKPIREKVLERQIDVTVNPAYSLSKWLSNNWEKLVAALVGIIGIIEGYRRLRLRRADDQSVGIASDRGRGLKRTLGRRRVRNRP